MSYRRSGVIGFLFGMGIALLLLAGIAGLASLYWQKGRRPKPTPPLVDLVPVCVVRSVERLVRLRLCVLVSRGINSFLTVFD